MRSNCENLYSVSASGNCFATVLSVDFRASYLSRSLVFDVRISVRRVRTGSRYPRRRGIIVGYSNAIAAKGGKEAIASKECVVVLQN
jgi:hypothetical protein